MFYFYKKFENVIHFINININFNYKCHIDKNKTSSILSNGMACDMNYNYFIFIDYIYARD